MLLITDPGIRHGVGRIIQAGIVLGPPGTGILTIHTGIITTIGMAGGIGEHLISISTITGMVRTEHIAGTLKYMAETDRLVFMKGLIIIRDQNLVKTCARNMQIII